MTSTIIILIITYFFLAYFFRKLSELLTDLKERDVDIWVLKKEIEEIRSERKQKNDCPHIATSTASKDRSPP